MVKLPLRKDALPGKHWLVYMNDYGEKKYIDLAGCACSFALVSGYVSEDGLRAVGWRYREQGQLCYELFNIGHTVFYAPLAPSFLQSLGYLLSGKSPKDGHKAFLASFEEALNQNGWKTVPREENEA